MSIRAEPTLHYGKWRIRWKDESGKRRSETFENKSDAQFALDRNLLAVEETRRGLRALTIPNKKFDELCDYWIRKRLPFKRSAREDRSMIERHLLPAFGSLLVRDIGTIHLDAFISARAHLNPKTVNNQLTLLSAMLHVAKDLKWIIEVPKIKKLKVVTEDAYFYLKTKDEIRRFLASAKFEGQEVYVLYATAIFTGLREGELAGLEPSDIDLNNRRITVRRSYKTPTKSGRPRTFVPILDPLLPLLREWLIQVPSGPLFPNEVGNMHQKSARIFQEIFHRVLDRAEFPLVYRNKQMRRYIRFHDLRHTFASHWMMDGGDIFKLQKVLGHQSIAMTMRYSHLAPQAFEEDYGRMGNCLPSDKPSIISLPVTPLYSSHSK